MLALKTGAFFLALLFLGGGTGARADAADYEFRLVSDTVRQGDETNIALRLIHKPTGKAVPDAVIFARRLDMAPDGMASMTAELEALRSDEPNVYLFKTSLAMAGSWQLSLAAKVQGETGTVQSKLLLKAE